MVNIPGALYSFFLSMINFLFLSVIGYYGVIIHTSKVKESVKIERLKKNFVFFRIICKVFFFRFIVV